MRTCLLAAASLLAKPVSGCRKHTVTTERSQLSLRVDVKGWHAASWQSCGLLHSGTQA